MLKKKLLILSLSGFLILAGFLIAGQVRALTDGVWNDEGNVGIGTTDPGTYRLNVSGDANFNTLYVDQVKLLDLPSNNPERGPWNPIWNIAGSSKPLYFDEEFSGGNNGVTVYNNAGGSAVTITRLTGQIGVPNSTGVMLRISYDGVGPVSPNFGGFVLSFTSSANKTYVQRFRAKLPVGKTLNINENSQGTNNTSYWLTSNVGTGKWEDYIRISHAGNTGTFSSGGHVSVSGGSGAFDWYLASANVYEVNTPIIASANTWRSVQDFASTIRGEGSGTYTAVPGAGTDSVSNAALVIDRGDYIYTEGNGYLRGLIGGDSSGNIIIGQTGTTLVPSISLRAGSAGYITLYSGGSETMRVTGNSVGIGTTNPAQTLSVAGTGSFTGVVSGVVPTADSHFVTKGYGDAAYAPIASSFWAASGNDIYNTNSGDTSRVLIGETTPISSTSSYTKLSILGTGMGGRDTNANSTQKWFRYFGGHYTNTEEPVTGLMVGSGSAANTVNIGGGTGAGNAATQINFYTAANTTTLTGSVRMVINSSGNVGIGTTNPTRLLEVKKASVGEIAFFNDGTQGLLLQTSSGVGSVIGYNGASYNAIDIRTVAGVGSGVYLSTSGNVGIGTTAPGYPLEVAGSVYANNGWFRSSGSNGWYSETYGGGWYMSDATWIRTYGSKSIYQNAGTLRTDGTLQVGSAGATLNVSSGGNFAYNTSTLFANTSGNVGIGTVSPSNILHIEGADGSGPTITGVTLQLRSNTGATSGRGGSLIFGDTGVAARAMIKGMFTGPASGGSLAFSTNSSANILSEHLRIDAAGSVGIGTTAPETKLHVADGPLTLSTATTQHYYNVADYSSGANTTGTMVVTLPKYGSSTMLRVKISGYDYSTGKGAWEVIISGYNYSDHNWHNYSVEFTGTPPFTQARLANNGTNDLILLGTTATSWQYPKVTISEVISGFGSITNWGTGWSMAVTTSEPTLYNIRTLTPKTFVNASGNLGIGTTNPVQTLSVAGTGSFTGTVSGVTPTAATHLATKDYVDTTIAGAGGGWIITSGKLYSTHTGSTQFAGGSYIAQSSARVLIAAASTSLTANEQPLTLLETSSIATDSGTGISFNGYIEGSVIPRAAIFGRKADSSSTSTAGYLQFATRAVTGDMTERMRITENGHVNIIGNSAYAVLNLENDNGSISLNEGLGTIYFKGYMSSDSTHRTGAMIRAVSSVDQDWTSGNTVNDAPTVLKFYAQSNGSGETALTNAALSILSSANGIARVGVGDWTSLDSTQRNLHREYVALAVYPNVSATYSFSAPGCTSCSVISEMAPVSEMPKNGDVMCIDPGTGEIERCREDKSDFVKGIAQEKAESIMRLGCSDTTKEEGGSNYQVIGVMDPSGWRKNPSCNGWYPIALIGLSEETNVVCRSPKGKRLGYGDILVTSDVPGRLRPLDKNEDVSSFQIVGRASTICSLDKELDSIHVWIN
ncbi:MAG: hypothetical protein WC545_03835 [Patescibacteria group bacterium]